MKFLCLGYYDADRFDTLNQARRDAIERDSRPCDEALQNCRSMHSIALLEHRRSVSLRPGRDGRPRVTDGPFNGNGTAVGAFFVLEADCLEEAVRIASMHPAARLGDDLGFGVEVLPAQWYEMVARIEEPSGAR